MTFSSLSVGCAETFSLDTTSFVRLSNLLGLFCCETFVTSFHLPLINSSLAFCFQSGIRLRTVDSVSLETVFTEPSSFFSALAFLALAFLALGVTGFSLTATSCSAPFTSLLRNRSTCSSVRAFAWCLIFTKPYS